MYIHRYVCMYRDSICDQIITRLGERKSWSPTVQGVFQKPHVICWTRSLTSPNRIPSVNTTLTVRA